MSVSPLREALWVSALATVAIFLLWNVGAKIPIVGEYLGALVTAVFLVFPAIVAWRNDEELADYGLTWQPIARGLAFAVGVSIVVFPLFLGGFVWFYQTVCARGPFSRIAPPGFCQHFFGWAALSQPRVGRDLASFAFNQLVAVGLPEELFFRGYLLLRLEEALPPRRRFLGGGLGLALVLSAAIFALAHVLGEFDARRLAVFFPGLLFGWMRSATGSILASTIVHAASNLYIDVLHRTFFQ